MSDSLFYTYEPEKKVFYDFERRYYNDIHSTVELDLELPEYQHLKTNMIWISIMLSNSISYSEFKIVTIVDLLT